MLDILLYTSAFLVILSKYLDCISTASKLVDIRQESNPLARKLFAITGHQRAIWLIFFLSIIIVSVSLYLVVRMYNSNPYKLFYIFLSLFISTIQFAVAHTNKSKRRNAISNLIYKIHRKFD